MTKAVYNFDILGKLSRQPPFEQSYNQWFTACW
jgi:hypothetical protein